MRALAPQASERTACVDDLVDALLPDLGDPAAGQESLEHLVNQSEKDDEAEQTTWRERHLPWRTRYPWLYPALERVKLRRAVHQHQRARDQRGGHAAGHPPGAAVLSGSHVRLRPAGNPRGHGGGPCLAAHRQRADPLRSGLCGGNVPRHQRVVPAGAAPRRRRGRLVALRRARREARGRGGASPLLPALPRGRRHHGRLCPGPGARGGYRSRELRARAGVSHAGRHGLLCPAGRPGLLGASRRGGPCRRGLFRHRNEGLRDLGNHWPEHWPGGPSGRRVPGCRSGEWRYMGPAQLGARWACGTLVCVSVHFDCPERTLYELSE